MFPEKSLICITVVAITAVCNYVSAATLLDTTNFGVSFNQAKVSLNIALVHSLNASDLSIGTIHPLTIDPEGIPLTSASRNIKAYCNSTYEHCVQIIASDPKYVSQDGSSFLMLGQIEGNNSSIPFHLQTCTLQDGSKAPGDCRDIFPGNNIIKVNVTARNHLQTRDLWAILRNNDDLLHIPADVYLAILTLNSYNNQ